MALDIEAREARGTTSTEPVSTWSMNTAPADLDPARDLPAGFMEFFVPLHHRFTPRQQEFLRQRQAILAASHQGKLPTYLPESIARTGDWQIELPTWCADQRNQMTGPADDAELVVKMLNSGAPGVMLDLEDSNANFWPNLSLGIKNIVSALRGELSYFDQKKQSQIAIKDPGSPTVIFTRARGLHISQAGVLKDELVSASLFDVCLVAYQLEPAQLKHPLSFYIPKSESAEEALWWNDLFKAIAAYKRWPADYIKCMALVEAHPLAFQMEEFLYNLRDHILGLNLGRWDYMASLIHFNFEDPGWVLPDRNTIPHDVPFFQNLRILMPEICHKRGALAIGGMTALYPSRVDPELNARALAVLEKDKKNEADCLMDGAWTGHPDQNQIAVDQFPAPNQLSKRPQLKSLQPDLRPAPEGIGKLTLSGTRAAVRTVIRYRSGVLNGKGASLLDGYMEDLATDRIYRLMIAQRMRHSDAVKMADENERPVQHSPELVTHIFDEELARILRELPAATEERERATFREARNISEAMIRSGKFDPI